MKKLTISSFLILFSAIFTVPQAIAQMPNDTRIEKYEDLTETESTDSISQSEMDMEMETEDGIIEPSTRTEQQLDEYQSSDVDRYDVRRTEAFNLVSSAYRGDFEEQGIDSYAVMINNYESGELTAEDIIKAAIESGELSPKAMEDESYVDAVDSQLNALISN